MKKREIIYMLLGFLVGVLAMIIIFNIPCVKYDTNRDGKITLNDAVRVINYYKEKRIKQNNTDEQIGD